MNWTVRIRNKTFWLTLVPALLLLAQTVGAVFGYTWDFAGIGERLTAVINALFAVLAIIGVAADPTTTGVADSARAMSYDEPAENAAHMRKDD